MTAPHADVHFHDPSLAGWSIAPSEPELIQVNAVPEPASAVLGAIAAALRVSSTA